MPVRYILSSVWVRLSIFSPLSIIQYGGLYVFSIPISLVMIERIYKLCIIIIIKSEVWTITHCLWLGHETMVSAVCLSIFLWICDMARLLRGTFVSWWYLSRIWPSVTDMQHYYHARYPTDDWHLAYMFSLVYFSVVVCLDGVFPHSVSTWGDSCVRVYAGFTPHKKTKSNRGDPALHLNQARGHLNCRVGVPALLGGNLGYRIVLISTYIAQFIGCVIGRIHMALRSFSVLDILLPSIIIIVQDYSHALNTYTCKRL